MSVDIEEVFPLLLGGKPAVTAIAGSRYFPNRLPERGSFPAVIWRRIGGSIVPTLNGTSTTKFGRFQVESWSEASQLEARQLDLAVQTIRTSSVQSGDWWIQSLLIATDTDQDNPQIPIHADDLGLFCSFCEMTIFYKLF